MPPFIPPIFFLNKSKTDDDINPFDISLKDIKDFFKRENLSVWLPTVLCCLACVVVGAAPLIKVYLFHHL